MYSMKTGGFTKNYKSYPVAENRECFHRDKGPLLGISTIGTEAESWSISVQQEKSTYSRTKYWTRT